jgi:hypothetical protein
MKLFFWKKPETPQPTKSTKPLEAQPTNPRLSVATPSPKKKIYALKQWCELELTPLAWSRIIVRLLPVLRDFDCDFSEMQKPGANTAVDPELYKIFLATIEEIYGKSMVVRQTQVVA